MPFVTVKFPSSPKRILPLKTSISADKEPLEVPVSVSFNLPLSVVSGVIKIPLFVMEIELAASPEAVAVSV